MRQWIAGISLILMFGLATVSTAPLDAQQKGQTRQTVTIRGCVIAGTEPDTFMLTRVTEIAPGQAREQPVPTDAQGRDVFYWLNSTKGLKREIGRRVEVNGTIDPSDPKEGTTKVTEDPGKRLDSTNKVTSGDKSVKAKTETSDAAVKSSVKETDRVVYRLKVISLRSVEGTCR
jgi:outer membrane biosynthesis protein TonB